MAVSLKYAVVERERRYRLASLPEGVASTTEIHDRYVTGTRLRLREVRESDGTVIRKLGHKVRLGDGPGEVACTNFYLDDQEWALLLALPARVLSKKRHIIERDGVRVAVDEHEDGTLVAEIDDRDDPAGVVPEWLVVVDDVSHDEAWTGARLAHDAHDPPCGWLLRQVTVDRLVRVDTPWLDEEQLDAWVRLIAVVELLPGVLDAQLRREAGLTHFEYLVLAMLSEAPERTLRMSALAQRTNAMLPRLSHVVRRLEDRELVERFPCPEDGRATNARLTDAGWAAVVGAAPGHVATVRRHVIDALSPEQVGQLTAITDALLERLDPDGLMTRR